MPVLLTTENAIPQATKAAMEVLDVTHVSNVGGEERARTSINGYPIEKYGENGNSHVK